MSKKALIIDDSRTAYMVLARILANYNIEGVHAKSGDEALEYLQKHYVDVIFLDQAMPGKDGFETIKEIKAIDGLSQIPVMMFTARSGKEYHDEVKALGAVGILPKELSAEEVEEALIKLNLWGAISGQTAVEHVENDVMQPTADEKLRVWLESFLENEFSPQLSNKVRKATDDLRRDTIHYGKRMLDEIAKSDKQQLMLQQVKGQTDYLKQLFMTSFRQYRLISSIFIAMLILLAGGILWLIYQVNSINKEQRTLEQRMADIHEESLAMTVDLTEKLEKQSEWVRSLTDEATEQQRSSSLTARDTGLSDLYSEQGYTGKVIGLNRNVDSLTAKSEQGYLFVISAEGRILESDIEKYYMQPGCNGTAYSNTLPGVVMRAGLPELAYTEIQSEPFVQRPVSWVNSDNECLEYQATHELVLRPLLRNDENVTGVRDTTFYYSE